jgi:type II secretory pathway pseudopilin PulG
MSIKRKTKGITLVELLVVGVMTGILSTALGLILVNFSRSAVNNVSVSDVQGDIQGAVSYVNTDLKMARYIYRPNGINCAALDTLKYCSARWQQTTGSDASIQDNGGSGNSGSTLSLNNLVNKTNAKIELAFWARATRDTDGEILSVPNALLAGNPFSESDAARNITNLVTYGTASSVPAYRLVIYYTTTPPNGSPFKGPRVLYRWQSGAVPIPYADFGYTGSGSASNIPASSTSNNITQNALATRVWVLDPPELGSGVAIADYLSINSSVSIANSPTNPQSVTVSIQGSMDSVQGNVDAQTKTSNLSKLLFSATTYARNICSPGAACPPDP